MARKIRACPRTLSPLARGRSSVILSVVSGLLISACGAPRFDASTLEGKAAILDQVNIALTDGDCTSAIAQIEGLYNSPYTNDQVRLARASSHGCNAGVNFFQMLGNIAKLSLTSGAIWGTLAQLFPSTPTDGRAESAWYATDALMAILKPGVVVSTSAQFNFTTVNPGSLFAANRDDNANVYMILISMAALGALENRYSAVNPTTFNQSQALGYIAGSRPNGWRKANAIDEEGCSFSASLLNMVDSIGQVSQKFSPQIASAFSALSSALSSGLDTACAQGCQSVLLNTGCTMTSACTACPLSLRNRKSCTGATTDVNSCAAAGIAQFVDASWAGNP